MIRKNLDWIVWLILVILWNYIFPNASPLEDVVVAVFFSILISSIKKIKKKNKIY